MTIHTNNGKKSQKFSVLYDQRKKTADFFSIVIMEVEKIARNYNKNKKPP